jgi:hypothetical protein
MPAAKDETLAQVRGQLEALSASASLLVDEKNPQEIYDTMVDMRGILDDLAKNMLEVGLAKDDLLEATNAARTRSPKDSRQHETKWSLVFSIRVVRFDNLAEAEAELEKAKERGERAYILPPTLVGRP